jgi:hypothetical protein
MRKVVLRWRLSTIEASKDLSRLLKIFDRFEVLAHLGVSSIGIVQLAEVEVKEGRDIHELNELDGIQAPALGIRHREQCQSLLSHPAHRSVGESSMSQTSNR